VITPEVAMAFIDHLAGYYGVDADITWLIDHHEIQVIVSANPDGHVRNETGYPWTYWRKNAQPYGSCSLNTIGVDLNRNFPTRWGCCGGSSGDPCAETYRGPAEKSEPETQAVIDAVRGLFRDQRLPGNLDAAPADASGMLISLHSYGNLVLWPWGWTAAPAPNGEELEVLGRKLASFNRYTPKQASGLYPADGTTDDWSYGELGIASYTFEIGSEFYPSCSQVDGLIQPNLQALLYAAKVARAPYLLPLGPDASDLTILEGIGGSPSLAAVIDDTANGGNPIAAAEITLDEPPWAGGESISMLPVDGAFDEAQEQVRADLEGLGLERHTIFIRGQDSLGYWGPVTAVYYNHKQPQVFLPLLIREQISSE
jgi:hypothetical protein